MPQPVSVFVERTDERLSGAFDPNQRAPVRILPVPHKSKPQPSINIMRSQLFTTVLALLFASPLSTPVYAIDSVIIDEAPMNDNRRDSKHRLSTIRLKTALRGFKRTELSPEEQGFFDATWVAAYQKFNIIPGKLVTNVEIVHQTLVESDHGTTSSLRGVSKEGSELDLELDIQWLCESCEEGADDPVFRQRQLLRTRRESRKLEQAVCQMLDLGPYDSLHGLECIIEIP